jgi:outer membrane receptor protein involved in Fe transport
MIKPSAAQTFRLSFNRAFRAPSYINNNIDTTILNQVDLARRASAAREFRVSDPRDGNESLEQETLTAYEIGYRRRRAQC